MGEYHRLVQRRAAPGRRRFVAPAEVVVWVVVAAVALAFVVVALLEALR